MQICEFTWTTTTTWTSTIMEHIVKLNLNCSLIFFPICLIKFHSKFLIVFSSISDSPNNRIMQIVRIFLFLLSASRSRCFCFTFSLSPSLSLPFSLFFSLSASLYLCLLSISAPWLWNLFFTTLSNGSQTWHTLDLIKNGRESNKCVACAMCIHCVLDWIILILLIENCR